MALGAIYAALKTLIAADAGVAALIANAPEAFGGGKAIYDEGGAPQGTVRLFPDITIGAGTMVPSNTFQTPGFNCTVQVKVTWQGAEAVGQAVITALSLLLKAGRALTVSGYTSSWCEEFVAQPTIVTIVSGSVTREAPVIVRVFAT